MKTSVFSRKNIIYDIIIWIQYELRLTNECPCLLKSKLSRADVPRRPSSTNLAVKVVRNRAYLVIDVDEVTDGQKVRPPVVLTFFRLGPHSGRPKWTAVHVRYGVHRQQHHRSVGGHHPTKLDEQ